MNKSSIYLSLFLLSSLVLKSQNLTRDSGSIINSSNFGFIGSNHLPDSFLNSNGKTIKYEDIEGSPYINNGIGANNNLPIGKVYTSDSKYLGSAFIRYNAYTDQMEISLMEDGIDYYYFKKKPNFHYVILKDKTYRAYTYTSKNFQALGYFIILSENDTNKCALLKKERIQFRKEVIPKNSFLSSTPASFYLAKPVYYLKFKDDIIELPKKKKDLLKVFPDKVEAMKLYLNANKIKLNNEDHILKMVTHYNAQFN